MKHCAFERDVVETVVAEDTVPGLASPAPRIDSAVDSLVVDHPSAPAESLVLDCNPVAADNPVALGNPAAGSLVVAESLVAMDRLAAVVDSLAVADSLVAAHSPVAADSPVAARILVVDYPAAVAGQDKPQEIADQLARHQDSSEPKRH